MGVIDIKFRVIEFDTVLLIGKKTIVEQGKTATKFVNEFRKDGSNIFLQNLPDRVSPKGDLIIWMGDYQEETKSFTEIPGVLVKSGSNVPEGYSAKELPTCTMGICTVTGTSRDITRGAHNKLIRSAKQTGYTPDYSFGYSMEYYPYEKYELGKEKYEFSYYLPCKRL